MSEVQKKCILYEERALECAILHWFIILWLILDESDKAYGMESFWGWDHAN